MGRDNQDYFKRAGRSGGPPGPLRQFREQLGKQQAEIARGGERGFPASQRPPFPPPQAGEEEQSAGPETEGNPTGEAEFEAKTPEKTKTADDNPTRRGSEERAGAPASQASFGPPASEEFVEGRRSGVQKTDSGAAHLFPRLSRLAALLAKASRVPAKKLAEFPKRIERAAGRR